MIIAELFVTVQVYDPGFRPDKSLLVGTGAKEGK